MPLRFFRADHRPSYTAKFIGEALITLGCSIVWLGTKLAGYKLAVRLPGAVNKIREVKP